jgi:hypothetical protein
MADAPGAVAPAALAPKALRQVQRAMRRAHRYRREIHAGARRQLTEARGVQRQRGTDLRVAADGLAIIEQHDRLAIRRNLDRPETDTLGQDARNVAADDGSFQPIAHAIAALRHAEPAAEKAPLLNPVEMPLLVAGYHAHGERVLVARLLLYRQVQALARRDGGAGQLVADLQAVAAQAADVLAHHGGGAAEARRNLEAVRNTEVGATAAAGKANLQGIARAHRVYFPQGLLLPVDRKWHRRAGEADVGVDLCRQLQSAHADLDGGAAHRVLQQGVAVVERLAVQRAAGGQPEAMLSAPPAVLQQAEHAGLHHCHAHDSSPPSAR